MKKLLLVAVTGLVYTWTILTATVFARYAIEYDYATALAELKSGALAGNVFSKSFSKSFLEFTLFFGIYEAWYYYAKLNQSEKEKQQLEKEKLWSQLEKLNQQVDPHFLFNTLHALSALITEDREEANKFLNELSKVYRYCTC